MSHPIRTPGRPRPGRPPIRSGLARRLRRRPLPHWLATGVLAVVSAASVAHLTDEAAAARGRWGEVGGVVVVVHDVTAGDRVTPDDLAVRTVPRGLVPAAALRAVPGGGVATVDLHAGEILVAGRLAGAGTSPTAAGVPARHRGIAVPNEGGLPLVRGDLVDVLATFDVDRSPPTFTVARSARVLATDSETVTLAVTFDETPRVAYALAAGRITLALVG